MEYDLINLFPLLICRFSMNRNSIGSDAIQNSPCTTISQGAGFWINFWLKPLERRSFIAHSECKSRLTLAHHQSTEGRIAWTAISDHWKLIMYVVMYMLQFGLCLLNFSMANWTYLTRICNFNCIHIHQRTPLLWSNIKKVEENEYVCIIILKFRFHDN